MEEKNNNENTSGLGKGHPLPEGIAGWSWGAFFLNAIWAFAHNIIWLGLLAIILFPFKIGIIPPTHGGDLYPIVLHPFEIEIWKTSLNNIELGLTLIYLGIIPQFTLLIAVLLGIKGREWAWRKKRWESVEQFNKAQRQWSIVGGAIFGAGILCLIGVALLVGFALSGWRM